MTTYKRQSTITEGSFLKWQAAETKTLTITSEHATQVWQHWIDNRSVPCTGEDCVHCENGRARTGRWRLEVNVDGEPATWEMANRVFANVEDVAEMQGTLKGLVLKVMRQGTGRQTRYTIVPMGIGDTMTKAKTDTQTRLAYAGELCKTLGVNARETYASWKTNETETIKGMSQNEVVNAFILHLEFLSAKLDTPDVDSAAQDIDIATMLDGL